MTTQASIRQRKTWTAAEVVALGVRTDVPTAGEIIAGLCRDESYRAVKRGTFPVPVIGVGRRLVVPVGADRTARHWPGHGNGRTSTT